MPALAIDVAVLLPPDAHAVAERANARFDVTAGNGFCFDATHHPHLTLVQQFVDANRIAEVTAAIAVVLSGLLPLDLRVTGARGGRTAQALVVAPTPALQRLHKRLMGALAPHDVPGTAAAFQQDTDPPRDADVAWVSGFRADSSQARFDPHNPVGIGPHALPIDPIAFTAREIAVCRLGRFCTCRDRLAHWTL